jgi:hypothetical protein
MNAESGRAADNPQPQVAAALSSYRSAVPTKVTGGSGRFRP